MSAFSPETAPWKLDARCLRAIDGDTQVYLASAVIHLPGEVVRVEREFTVSYPTADATGVTPSANLTATFF